MDKSREQKKQEGLELFRQYLERLKQMSPEERAKEEAKGEALLQELLPEGHTWHRMDEEE